MHIFWYNKRHAFHKKRTEQMWKCLRQIHITNGVFSLLWFGNYQNTGNLLKISVWLSANSNWHRKSIDSFVDMLSAINPLDLLLPL